MGPLWATALRLMIVGGLGFLMEPKLPRRSDLLQLWVLSITLFCIPMGLTSFALTRVDPSVAAFITELEVPFAMILGAMFFQEEMSWNKIIGLILAFSGVYLIFESPDVSGVSLGVLSGLIVVALSYAVAALQVKFISVTPLVMTTASAWLGAVQLSVLALVAGEPLQGSWSLVSIMGGISFICFALWNWLLAHFPVSKVVPFAMLIPLFALLFEFLFWGQSLSLMGLVGGLLTLVGVGFQLRKEKE
jgi:O-acetylserine/cysteine efflux transporter